MGTPHRAPVSTRVLLSVYDLSGGAARIGGVDEIHTRFPMNYLEIGILRSAFFEKVFCGYLWVVRVILEKASKHRVVETVSPAPGSGLPRAEVSGSASGRRASAGCAASAGQPSAGYHSRAR